jgi:hypothetical protein
MVCLSERVVARELEGFRVLDPEVVESGEKRKLKVL